MTDISIIYHGSCCQQCYCVLALQTRNLADFSTFSRLIRDLAFAIALCGSDVRADSGDHVPIQSIGRSTAMTQVEANSERQLTVTDTDGRRRISNALVPAACVVALLLAFAGCERRHRRRRPHRIRCASSGRRQQAAGHAAERLVRSDARAVRRVQQGVRQALARGTRPRR